MLTNKNSVTNTDFVLTDLDVDADNNGGTAGDATPPATPPAKKV